MSDRIMFFTDIAEFEVKETIQRNALTLDIVTGPCDELGEEPDDARYYIYESICKGHVNGHNLDVYINLYERFLQEQVPTEDDGQLLLDTVS